VTILISLLWENDYFNNGLYTVTVVKIEKDQINYCQQNQKQLRAETYQGLIDYLIISRKHG